MTDSDQLESARQALWTARKSLDATPAGGTIAPQLRGVYVSADRAYSALTMTADREAALQHARNARAILTGAAIDVAALEEWLGTYSGGEPLRVFIQRVTEDLNTAVTVLTAGDGTQV